MKFRTKRKPVNFIHSFCYHMEVDDYIDEGRIEITLYLYDSDEISGRAVEFGKLTVHDYDTEEKLRSRVRDLVTFANFTASMDLETLAEMLDRIITTEF